MDNISASIGGSSKESWHPTFVRFTPQDIAHTQTPLDIAETLGYCGAICAGTGFRSACCQSTRIQRTVCSFS